MTRDPGSQTATEEDDAPLGTWAEFHLVGRLGDGGYGTVYRARREGEELALKILWPPPSAREISRFIREQVLVADLRHRNVVEIRDFGKRDQGPFIAMELVRGGDLDRLILRDQLGLEVALVRSMVAQIAGALDFVHGRGIIH
ncbi:MAG: protein kinase, partial [Actinomycetota bacterium]|nr:protein kinase [Actinomycetota bacterium]